MKDEYQIIPNHDGCAIVKDDKVVCLTTGSAASARTLIGTPSFRAEVDKWIDAVNGPPASDALAARSDAQALYALTRKLEDVAATREP